MSDVTACDSHATMGKHKVPIYEILQLKMLQELKVYVGLYKPKVIVPISVAACTVTTSVLHSSLMGYLQWRWHM